MALAAPFSNPKARWRDGQRQLDTHMTKTQYKLKSKKIIYICKYVHKIYICNMYIKIHIYIYTLYMHTHRDVVLLCSNIGRAKTMAKYPRHFVHSASGSIFLM